jgi:hypothetical protein
MRNALAFAIVLMPLSAQADIPPRQPRPTLSLVPVDYRAGGDAPAPDNEAVTASVRDQLYARDGRVGQCLRGSDLREDPLRTRTRRVTVVLRFSRSARPAVSTEGGSMPAHVRSCILEAARSIRSSTTPRGTVTVRAVYELGAGW